MLHRVDEAVILRFQRIEHVRVGSKLALRDGDDARFHHVREFTQAHRADHASAALDGMQGTLQGVTRRGVVRRRLPFAQLGAAVGNERLGLLEEDR